MFIYVHMQGSQDEQHKVRVNVFCQARPLKQRERLYALMPLIVKIRPV